MDTNTSNTAAPTAAAVSAAAAVNISNRLKALNLLSQLRTRRQFSFNGMRFEANSQPRIKGGAQQQQQQQQEAAGDGRSLVQKKLDERMSLRGGQAATQQIPPRMPWQLIKDRAGGETASRCRCHLNNSFEEENKKEEEEEQQEQAPCKPPATYSSTLGGPPRLLLAQSILARSGASNSLVGPTALHYSKMDYITLAGFLLGCVVSNVLFFLCWYFSWLKCQVIKLRQHFLGQANLWEFFDFEDTTRYSIQTKLLLAPIIIACSLLYCVVNILHLVVKVVRADVPRTVVDLVQHVASSGLLATGRYRW